MKTQTDNGGAAFPPMTYDSIMQGMTLRDYFAAAALQGICANLHCTPEVTFKEVSLRAYDQADAMLAARKEDA